MSNKNYKTSEKSELQQVNDNLFESNALKIVEYRSPEVHFLGDLEKVQANYAGQYLDGSSSNFYYSG